MNVIIRISVNSLEEASAALQKISETFESLKIKHPNIVINVEVLVG